MMRKLLSRASGILFTMFSSICSKYTYQSTNTVNTKMKQHFPYITKSQSRNRVSIKEKRTNTQT